MTFLFDENIPQRLCVVVRANGFDVVGVAELERAGAPDGEVWELAIALGRVLVTLDADFANLLRFPPKGTPGVVRLKVHPAIDALILEQLETTLPTLLSYPTEGCLAVAEGKKIRIRHG